MSEPKAPTLDAGAKVRQNNETAKPSTKKITRAEFSSTTLEINSIAKSFLQRYGSSQKYEKTEKCVRFEYPNPRKYWSVLKTRLKKSGNELNTRCSQLKMTAADGKRYATDCFAEDDIIQLVRVIPSKKSEDFLDWFVYSDNTLDGQSKKKAYTLLESGLLDSMKPGTVKSLQQIHAFLFCPSSDSMTP